MGDSLNVSIAFVLNHFRLHAKLGQDTWLDKTGQ